MKKFKLVVKLDPKKDVVSRLEARKLLGNVPENCPISRAVRRTLDATPRRFRRWRSVSVKTMFSVTFIDVVDRDGTTREYRATLPNSLHQQRWNYDEGSKVHSAQGTLVYQ